MNTGDQVQAAAGGGAGAALARFAAALAFVAVVAGWMWFQFGQVSLTLVAAGIIGVYMAMNIGANDVANNVGPAVGAKAMSLGRAVAIAAVFEAAGAIIAGGEVVGTIKSGIIDPARIDDAGTFVWVMMAALLAAALWLNLATASGAPVSTTHSIVGGVLGAGVAAAGTDIANWGKLVQIAASWVVSPVLGGVIAALLLYVIKRRITYRDDIMTAAGHTVPRLLGLMGWSFATYLLLKGVSQLVKVSFPVALGLGFLVGLAVWWWTRQRIRSRLPSLAAGKDSVNALFAIPLMFAAALLSFAHGSNDVANAIGPLAAINDALLGQGIHEKAQVPFWIMLIGALGISIGLLLYGPRLIRTVGGEITELDPMRAFAIAMSATLTVILASQLGLPVSTTHVAIGAVFGVGFLREYLKANYQRILDDIESHHSAQQTEHAEVEAFRREFEAAPMRRKTEMLRELKARGKAGQSHITRKERKSLRRFHRQQLVKRSVVFKVVAAWIITVPASALLAAVAYFAIAGAMEG